jgi:class 3 adenylate cyclase
MFSHDTRALLLSPLESMMLKVGMVRINPMLATRLSDDAFAHEERVKGQLRMDTFSRKARLKKIFCCVHEKPSQPMETMILENTLIKLGTLLAVGFGEAGSSVISRCMMGSDLDPSEVLAAGAEVKCIIGKARIGDFDIITQILSKHVMTFVNQVAEIVHGVVDEFGGAINRSDGDSFLLVWSFEGLDNNQAAKLADMSMVAFAHIFSAVNTSRTLAEYRLHPGLQFRIAKFRVTIALGLHCGWAIEGAVGTEFKIDASYISPHVQVAEAMEQTTKIYGVGIVVSGDLMKRCSSEMSSKCRRMDRLTVKCSKEPLDVYCIDVSNKFITVEGPRSSKIPNYTSQQRFRARQELSAGKKLKWSEGVDMMQYFSGCLSVNATRMPYTKEFMEIFKMGYQNYVEGEWHIAKRIFANTYQMLGFPDGPSAALLRYMRAHDFIPPDSWQGVHSLESMIQVHCEFVIAQAEHNNRSGSPTGGFLTGTSPKSPISKVLGQSLQSATPTSRGGVAENAMSRCMQPSPAKSSVAVDSKGETGRPFSLRWAADAGENGKLLPEQNLRSNPGEDLVSIACEEAKIAAEARAEIRCKLR